MSFLAANLLAEKEYEALSGMTEECRFDEDGLRNAVNALGVDLGRTPLPAWDLAVIQAAADPDAFEVHFPLFDADGSHSAILDILATRTDLGTWRLCILGLRAAAGRE